MNAEERRFVLWGLQEGWSAARISRGLGVNEATVRRFRKHFKQDPNLLLQLGLYEMVGRAREDEYRCLVCGDHVIERPKVNRHILLHFLDKSQVRPALSSREQAGDPPAATSIRSGPRPLASSSEMASGSPESDVSDSHEAEDTSTSASPLPQPPVEEATPVRPPVNPPGGAPVASGRLVDSDIIADDPDIQPIEPEPEDAQTPIDIGATESLDAMVERAMRLVRERSEELAGIQRRDLSFDYSPATEEQTAELPYPPEESQEDRAGPLADDGVEEQTPLPPVPAETEDVSDILRAAPLPPGQEAQQEAPQADITQDSPSDDYEGRQESGDRRLQELQSVVGEPISSTPIEGGPPGLDLDSDELHQAFQQLAAEKGVSPTPDSPAPEGLDISSFQEAIDRIASPLNQGGPAPEPTNRVIEGVATHSSAPSGKEQPFAQTSEPPSDTDESDDPWWEEEL